MRTLFASLLIVFGTVLQVMPCQAVEFQPLGFKSMSMGGAGVASASGSYAAYYNPALLAVHKHGLEIAISPGIAYREINLVDSIDTLAALEIVDGEEMTIIDKTIHELEEIIEFFKEMKLAEIEQATGSARQFEIYYKHGLDRRKKLSEALKFYER